MIFKTEQMNSFRRMAEIKFRRAVIDQMRADHPGFKSLTTEQQQSFIDPALAWARHFGFTSERALAFWSNVTWVLQPQWHEHVDLQPVLNDLAPSEPERLFRLKTAIETAQWNG
ncbi:hypothetical protein [Yoonia sp. 2307UL14-13]|uniref:hypothetical protein n=1 Tax=Yoonia sp. 2307UL14-13 TaxID=3126506 RepID=UPI0030B6136B